MSIVGAAFVPHTPLLLPTTDAEHAAHLADLRAAMGGLAQWVHAAKPDITLCCNPHALSVGNTFTFNLAQTVTARFDEFGDLSTLVHFKGAPKFAYHLKERLEAHFPVSVVHEARCNYGTGIPALYFEHIPEPLAWVELSTRRASPASHVQFGRLLQNEMSNSPLRIILLATGEITSRLTNATPDGIAPEAAPYYKEWSKRLQRGTLVELLERTPSELVESIQSCGTWSVAVILGALQSVRVRAEVLYDGTPYGTAYQVVTWQPA